MNSVHKSLAFLALILWGASAGFAQQGVIRDFAGTVEIKRASSAKWESARKGQIMENNTMISTGFRSTALIALGNSILTVRPLTRLTLVELSRMQDDEKVELRLQTGRVHAEVKKAEEGRTDFTVRSSAATASVRGTAFELDTRNLRVIEGTVEFSGLSGGAALIDAGHSSYTDEDSLSLPEGFASAPLKPSLPLGGTAGLKSSPPPGTEGAGPDQDSPVVVPPPQNNLFVTVGF
jgi:hypothetical protein